MNGGGSERGSASSAEARFMKAHFAAVAAREMEQQELDLQTNIDPDEDDPLNYCRNGEKTYERACERLGIPVNARVRDSLLTDSPILVINNYGIGDRGAEALSLALTRNDSVIDLQLHGNIFSKEGFLHLNRMLCQNRTITRLTLSDVGLDSSRLGTVLNVVSENWVLEELDLSKNRLMDIDAQALVDAVLHHDRLKLLRLSANKFCDGCGPAFAQLITQSVRIEEFDLSWNSIRSVAAVQIAKSVKETGQISNLDVSWNGFGDNGAAAFAAALKTNTTIERLNLSSNRIGDHGFLLLIKVMVQENRFLTALNISRNQISEKVAATALEFIQNSPDFHLSELDLSGVIYGRSFEAKVEACNRIHAELNISWGYADQYGKRRLKSFNQLDDAIEQLRAYIKRHNVALAALFSEFDEDGSMSVTYDEFRIGLKKAGVPLTDTQVSLLIKAFDTDGDGEIDFSEFVVVTG